MGSKDADVASCLTDHDIRAIRKTYKIPTHIKLFAPTKYQRVNDEESRRVAVHEEPLKLGIRFPFEGLVADFLRTFRIPPGQLTPNSWRILRRLEIWARATGVRLTGPCLQHVLTVKWSGVFLAVQGIGNTKVVSGLPSSNKNWKPRFFFARRMGEDGEYRHWDVPVGWRTDIPVGRGPALTNDERLALGALQEDLTNEPIPFDTQSVSEKVCAEKPKRPRDVAEASSAAEASGAAEVSSEPPLEVVPLRAVPAEPTVERAGPSKRRRLAKKAGKESPTERQLRQAEAESAALFQEEEARRKEMEKQRRKEEEELQMALQASAAAAAPYLVIDDDEPSTPVGTLQDEVEAFSLALTVTAGSGPSAAAEEPKAPAAADVPVAEGEGAVAEVSAVVQVAEAARPAEGEAAGAAGTKEDVAAEADRPAMDAAEAKAPHILKPAEPTGEGEARSPPRSRPSAETGVSGSPLPERVRLARLKPSTLRPLPKGIFIPVDRQGLAARVKACMIKDAESGGMTSQSPVDIAAVGSARGEAMHQRVDLQGKVEKAKAALKGKGSSASADASEAVSAAEDKLLAAQMGIRELDKSPMPPLNRQPERRIGGPLGPEVHPGAVDYDLHAVSGLRHLSEREGRPLLPGGSSYDPRDRKASSVQVLARTMEEVTSSVVAGVNIILEREAAREEEVRRESFSEGKASAENAWYLKYLERESEIARCRDRVCQADTLANAAVRERDARAHDAAKAEARAAEAEARADEAEARAKQLQEDNDHLSQHAALEAEAAAQERVDQLERRTQEAESSARQAESARDEAVEKAALVGGQLKLTEARVEALEAEVRAKEGEVAVAQQEASRLWERETQLAARVSLLTAELEKAETTAEAAVAMSWQAGVQAAEAEGLSAESLRRAEDAEAELVKAKSLVAPAVSGEAAAAFEQRLLELQRAASEREAAFKARVTEAEEAKAALSLQVKELQRSLEEMKALTEAEAREAELREVRSNVDYFNAAVREIQEKYPQHDLSEFFVARP